MQVKRIVPFQDDFSCLRNDYVMPKVCIAYDKTAKCRRALCLHSSLNQALIEGGVEVHFRPQVITGTRKQKRLQLLLRLSLPTIGGQMIRLVKKYSSDGVSGGLEK